MNSETGVIITGGDFQALGAMRALARKGVPVILLDNETCIGRFSKFKRKFLKAPLLSEPESYVDFLIQLARTESVDGWVLLPNSDEAVFLLSKNRDTLDSYYRVPTPSWDVIKNVYIKKNTYRIAERNGIPIPRTFYPKNLEELLRLDLQFPMVIKPSVRDHFYSKVKVKAFLVNNRRSLEETYLRVCSVIPPSEVLVQEFIPGGPKNLYSFCPFFKNGEILASITARRARQHPMDFGHASTYAELVDIPNLAAISKAFLTAIDYYGIGEVEFMKDPHTGEYKLIELNPRIWGWHTLAIAAGINLPFLLYNDMLGQEIELPGTLKDVKWIRLITDIPTVIKELAMGKMTVFDYLRSLKGGKEFAVFSLADPLPFIAEIAMIPYLFKKRSF